MLKYNNNDDVKNKNILPIKFINEKGDALKAIKSLPNQNNRVTNTTTHT